MTQPLLLCLALCVIIACKKENDQPAPVTTSSATVIGTTTAGIFMWVEDNDELGYLYADDAGGWINRGTTAVGYPLSQLAEDDNCRVEWTSTRAPDNTICYGIHMPGTEGWWRGGMSSGFTILKQDDLDTESLPLTGIQWLWRRHTIGTHDGHTLYAMESYQFPNMYWSAEGTMGSWIKVHLEEHVDPANAQGFMFR